MLHNTSGFIIKHVKYIQNSKSKAISSPIIVSVCTNKIKSRAEKKTQSTDIVTYFRIQKHKLKK